jgi:hypothetical protein
MFCLLHEKKYYTKDELRCFANYCEKKLDEALKDLQKSGLVSVEGWLVRITDHEKLMETLMLPEPQTKRKS